MYCMLIMYTFFKNVKLVSVVPYTLDRRQSPGLSQAHRLEHLKYLARILVVDYNALPLRTEIRIECIFKGDLGSHPYVVDHTADHLSTISNCLSLELLKLIQRW